MARQTHIGLAFLLFMALVFASPALAVELYDLDTGLESRSISFENPTGARGAGGQASSHLGQGRKGFPAKQIAAGEEVVLCDIQGKGTIRHIWATGGFKDNTALLRKAIVRAWWDGQSHPSIECPLGDFFGLANAKVTAYQSAIHSIGKNAALNIWLPMPFRHHAKITLTNTADKAFTLFYQIDYTLGDKHQPGVGCLHTLFRRENPTTIKEDFVLLPKRRGKGRLIGSLIGIRMLEGNWWGEGEVKMFIDGDTDFPTICGTGSEDYVCLSYGIQQTPYLYHGCNYEDKEQVSMYRWHLLDPIVWEKDIRVTIQQIGWSRDKPGHLYERKDDWCCATFWYEPIPSAPIPSLVND